MSDELKQLEEDLKEKIQYCFYLASYADEGNSSGFYIFRSPKGEGGCIQEIFHFVDQNKYLKRENKTIKTLKKHIKNIDYEINNIENLFNSRRGKHHLREKL